MRGHQIVDRICTALLAGVTTAWATALIELTVQLALGENRGLVHVGYALLSYGVLGVVLGISWGTLLVLIQRPLGVDNRGFTALLWPGLACGHAILVIGYWLNSWRGMPSFTSIAGKLWTLFVVGALILIAGLVAAVLWKRLPPARLGSTRWIRGRIVAAAVVLATLCVSIATTTNPAALWRGEPVVSPSNRAPVIVLLVDTLRRDHLGCYGYPLPTSPNIDALAEDSILFLNSTTTGNFTLPSTASLFTGLYPTTHGMLHPRDRMAQDASTLGEVFHAAGYRTGAFIANPTVRAEAGFARGFDRFHPSPPPRWIRNRVSALELLAARLTGGGDVSLAANLVPIALQWLREESPYPPFLYLHILEPHSPYAPPREHAQLFLRPDAAEWELDTFHIQDYRTHDEEWSSWEEVPDPPKLAQQELSDMVALYDGEIHYVDEWIGVIIRALRELGIYDSSYVVLVSDHGEEFQDHDGWFHGVTLYGEMTDMPLLIKPPSRPGIAVRTPMSMDMVDLLPTLADLVGAPINGLAQGRSYASGIESLLQGEQIDEHVSAFLERPPFIYSLRTGDWKLIQKSVYVDPPQFQLFNLSSDPKEQTDLSAVYPDTLADLSAMLTSLLQTLEPAELSAGTDRLDPETLEALRTLGYVD